METNIVLRNVTKNFGEKEVLKDIHLEVGTGEIFGLLGPSGAGKTTLIKIITGQLKRSSGEAYLMGKDCGQLTREDYAAIGMMMDNAGLYERLSCYDNLELFARVYGMKQADRKLEGILRAVGLWEARKQPVLKLSKGMRGRLALARAVMHEPQILFLDEPTSGLDPATAKEIHKLILAQKERGATVFLTTHNMEEAEKLCDRVALLNEGEIVVSGKPDAICRQHNTTGTIRILLKGGEWMTIANEASEAERVKTYMEKGMIESIHSMEPNLEEVFLELTGRKLEV